MLEAENSGTEDCNKGLTEAEFLEIMIKELKIFLDDPSMKLTLNEQLQHQQRLKSLEELRPLYVATDASKLPAPRYLPGKSVASNTDHSLKK